jgi:hypothetical protein
MSDASSPHHPADLARQRAEDAQYYRRVLHKLIDMGTDLAEAVHRQATAQPATEKRATQPGAAPAPAAPDLAIAFDRLARTIRRTIALARKLSEPDRTPDPVKQTAERTRHRPSAPRRIDGADPYAHLSDAELLERLDAPDLDEDDECNEFDDDLDDQPLATLIAGIHRDLGLDLSQDAPEGAPESAQADELDPNTHAAQPATMQPQAQPPPAALPPLARTGTGPPAT